MCVFYGESCPRLSVHPGSAWPSSLACICNALFLALSLSPGKSFVSSWCDHSMLASLLWRCLTVPSSLQLCLRTHSYVFFDVHETPESFSVLSSQRRQDMFLHSFWESSFHSRMLLQATVVLSLVVSLLKSVRCDFSMFSAVMLRLPDTCFLFYLVWNFVVYSPSSVIRDPRYRKLHQLFILNKYVAEPANRMMSSA